jgi:hypothetical protein
MADESNFYLGEVLGDAGFHVDPVSLKNAHELRGSGFGVAESENGTVFVVMAHLDEDEKTHDVWYAPFETFTEFISRGCAVVMEIEKKQRSKN